MLIFILFVTVKDILKYNTAWFVWVLFILYVMLIKQSSIPHFDINLIIPADKLVHAFLFFILMLFLCVGFYFQHYLLFNKHKGFVLFFFLGAAFGCTTELLQKFLTTDRTAELNDFIADVIGLIIGGLIFEFYFKKNLMQKKKLLHF